MFFSFVQATFTYSFPAHWLWDSEGWLKVRGVYDFAGASTVHITGGAASLIAAAFLGKKTRIYLEMEGKLLVFITELGLNTYTEFK